MKDCLDLNFKSGLLFEFPSKIEQMQDKIKDRAVSRKLDHKIKIAEYRFSNCALASISSPCLSSSAIGSYERFALPLPSFSSHTSQKVKNSIFLIQILFSFHHSYANTTFIDMLKTQIFSAH